MTQTVIQATAALALAYFEHRTREDGSAFVVLNSVGENVQHAEWVRTMVRDAHGDMMPDDYRYAFVVEALQALEENEDADEARDGIEAEIYTARLLDWVGSNLTRTGYVDEAAEELGWPGNLCTLLQLGQLREKLEVFDVVRQAVEEEADRAEWDGVEADD